MMSDDAIRGLEAAYRDWFVLAADAADGRVYEPAIYLESLRAIAALGGALSPGVRDATYWKAAGDYARDQGRDPVAGARLA